MSKIVISGNCLRYPIAAQLMQWFPSLEIITLETPNNDYECQVVHQKLSTSDLWVSMGLSEDFVKSVASPLLDRIRTLRIPTLGFAAFHPDICLVSDRESGRSTRVPFNSAIAAWAFSNEMSASSAASLFNESNFRRLGYFDEWNPSTSYLRRSFEESDLSNDFTRFFYAVKCHGDGCFMHTFNHPTAFANAALCRLICNNFELDVPNEMILHESAIPSSQVQWPVYPEIAQLLGLGTGSYTWDIFDQKIVGVSDYIDWQYNQYQAEGFTPKTLQLLNRNLTLMNQVLAS